MGEALNEHKKSIKGSRVLILGAAYKKDVDDVRESPTLKLIEILEDRGAKVDYNDPYIPKMPHVRKYRFEMKSVPLTPANIKKYDVILISTDHSCYDYQKIVTHAKLVIDTRNATRKIRSNRNKITKA
jgi:UDP-N-acetyl-D-glucosamine dehydrogenase